MPAWCREERSGSSVSLVLAVHAQPGAKASGIAGGHGDALRIRLAAPAVEGKANAELVRFLAQAFGVGRGSVTLLRGDTGRRKLLRIEAPRLRPDREWT
jgi:uncharacterized protein (TIGR00251 family)